MPQWIKISLIALGISASSTAFAAPTYSFTSLGSLGGISIAYDINNAGQVVGSSDSSSGNRAFIYDDINGMQSLGTLRDGGTSEARGINDAGQVVGISNGPFLYDSTNGMQSLGVSGIANDINDAGQVVGSFYSSGIRAFLYDNTSGTQNLGTLSGGDVSFAYAINNAGQVVGSSQNTYTYSSDIFIYDDTNGMQSLGGYSGGGNDINDAGQVVGALNRGAFLYDSTNGMQSLGTLSGRNVSIAHGINDAGQVVGAAYNTVDGVLGDYRAFIYDNDTMTDLNSLVTPSSLGDWSLREAQAINDLGQIVGRAYNATTNQNHAFLLSPVPEPATLPLMACGLGLLLSVVKRRKQ